MKLEHGRVGLELQPLRKAEGVPLLLLHALGGRASDWVTGEARDAWQDWRGPVHALDFAGHGASSPIRGGGYTPEFFLADADIALEAIGGSAVIVGDGIGAYAALLLAGSRPGDIRGALLRPGRGLAGGGTAPDWTRVVRADEWATRRETLASAYAPGTDPDVSQCETDLRPLDYVESFAMRAQALLFSSTLPDSDAPEWWIEARKASGGRVASADPAIAVRELAALAEMANR
jgi:pimeloyl-ACP methyl ester carboxylesterase